MDMKHIWGLCRLWTGVEDGSINWGIVPLEGYREMGESQVRKNYGRMGMRQVTILRKWLLVSAPAQIVPVHGAYFTF